MLRLPLTVRMVLATATIVSFSSYSPVTIVRAAPETPRISWSPCYQETGRPFECGTVQVPLDHDEPGGAAISIALIRLAHTGPATRIGSLFLNPGGPGGSGVDFLITTAPFFAGLQRWFDLVSFDPRGVARSTAVRCFGNETQWLGVETPFLFPVTREEEALWETADQYVADACKQRAGRIIDHMSTANVARDGLDVDEHRCPHVLNEIA